MKNQQGYYPMQGITARDKKGAYCLRSLEGFIPSKAVCAFFIPCCYPLHRIKKAQTKRLIPFPAFLSFHSKNQEKGFGFCFAKRVTKR